MKRFFAILLVMCLLCTCWAEETETETETAELGEGEILMHGYISPFANYYIGVPAEWCLIGAGSTGENLSQASEELEDVDVYGLYNQMKAGNDVLYAVSPSGEGLILTYGSSSGVGNDAIVDSLDEIKAALSEQYSGVVFDEDSGSYTYNSIYEILYIGMNYKNRNIYQYYLVTGTVMYIFTFFGTSSDIAETVLSTFSMAD